MKIRSGKINALLVTSVFAIVFHGSSIAQNPSLPPVIIDRTTSTEPPAKISTENIVRAGGWKFVFAPKPFISSVGGETFERSIAVDPRVSVSLCVTQGDVKINGWSRNEVRVFVKDGSKVGFNIQQKNTRTGNVEWIKVVGTNPGKPSAPQECLWGSEVEIDAPIGAAINLEGKETSTIIDSVRKASVKNVGGNISIRNVTEGVNASTYEGDIDIENSDGMITLVSASGNIVAFESAPSQVGDIFRAKTNSGTISLQGVEHRQVESNSISGSILFNSDLLSGGIYSIGTSNGSISLGLQPEPPCSISATYGFGNFTSELTIIPATENITPGPIKTVIGTFGKGGDCKLNVTSSSGTIHIRKK